MQDGWNQKIRQRASTLWEAEGRPDGRNLDHWLRAEDELWKEALHTTTALAEYVNHMGRNLDEGTEDGLRVAAETGCRAMRFLIEETDFKAQLADFAGRPPLTVWSPDAKAYLSDLDLFEDFLAVERKILVRSGLDPVLSEQIVSFLKRQIDRLRAGDIGSAAKGLIDVAVYRACEAWETIRDRRPPPPSIGSQVGAWYRRCGRSVWTALGGGLVFATNVAAAAGLDPLLGEGSKLGGTFMFEHGLTRVFSAP
jgi:hypothetical protein